MSSTLLENTRRLNKILQESGSDRIVFSDMANVLSEILDCNVFISSRKGKIIGYALPYKSRSIQPFDQTDTSELHFNEKYNEELLDYNETEANINADNSSHVLVTVVPIRSGLEKLGALVFERFGKEMTTDDLILAEYSATVVGMEIVRTKTEENEEEARKKAVVQMAIGTLSYSELEAVDHIFRELDGNEGLLVASKIADRVGITRSVIVNALRKFESAGVIESRSLGMKGTHIKILNDKLLPELAKSR